MSMETDLVALLKTVCVRTFPDVAPAGTDKPYITWQGIGGESWRYSDGSAMDKRNTLMQVRTWATTRSEANSLARQVEDALCAFAAFTVIPEGELVSDYEESTQLYGAIQRFTIVAVR